MGYERGEKVMQERTATLKNEGKMREAQNAARLASAYGSEATLLRNILS
jgi:hypothetical protein